MKKFLHRISSVRFPALLALSLIVVNHAGGADPGPLKTVWLDSLDLSTMEQGWGEPQVNRSIRNRQISIGGRKFERGVGTHSPSSYQLNLSGDAVQFEAIVGLDDSANGPGSVVFQVFVDGKKAFDSGVIRSNSPARAVSVNLSGAQSVRLVVTDAGDNYQYDHANWADARFTIRGAMPAPVAHPGITTDPLATLKFPGRSARQLASPVRLPFERRLPGPVTDWVLMEADGEGHKEYYLRFTELSDQGFRYSQRRGRASNGRKPMWVLANKSTGKGLALMLAYMGNWTFEITPAGEQIVVRLATSPADLKPFQKIGGLPIPGALVSEFTGHWDYGTQPIVRYIRENLLRDHGPAWPPVQYNTWYDLYDKLTQQRLLEAAGVASSMGCELFTIDAGWFGDGLDAGWSQTLGDWEVNRSRLPDGLGAVAAEVHRLGMKFGLWFEIECAAPASRLAREHPDWFLKGPDGKPLSKRGMLDFGKPEVLQHAKNVIDDAVRRYSLDYIKMDFNTDPAIENEGLSQAADPLYGHYRGMARLWSYLREKHPALIVEDCSSGARRHELTSAALTDTHWISDTIDNRPNLLIMLGATYFFPASTCSHWTTRPDKKDSMLDLDAQFAVNMMGHFGLSGAVASWDAETQAITRDRIAQYKRLRPLLGKADVFHLTTPRLGSIQAALYNDPGSGRALLFAFHAGDRSLSHTIPLRGLDQSKRYRLSVPIGHQGMLAEHGTIAGEELVKRGLELKFPHSGAAALVELEPEEQTSAIGPVLFMGGLGGVYFLAEPGELVVEIEKRDRNLRDAPSNLRVLLLGPDRSVLQEEIIPDDGQPRGSGMGPVQRVRLSAKVPAKGIYALNVTASQDRYGQEVVWGFRSNCPKYLVETARGHKDEEHKEPIVLASPERAGDVVFQPRSGAFGIEVSELPKGVKSLSVYDAQDNTIVTLPIDSGGRVVHRFAAGDRKAAPWRLHLPAAQGTVSIDGLTRWHSGDPHPDMACWTPDPQSWFAFLENRWLLTPYSRTVYAQPGQQQETLFKVHNNSRSEKTVQLRVEFPAGESQTNGLQVLLSQERVTVAPGQTKTVTVRYALSGSVSPGLVRIRATPLDDTGFSTYSTLRVHPGESPARSPLTLPLVLKPYEHENEQFGYEPDYPVENQVYFDRLNRPAVRTAGGVATWMAGRWTNALFRSAARFQTPVLQRESIEVASTKIAFDRDNHLYTLAWAGQRALLMHSTDGGQSFASCEIPGRESAHRAFDLEQFSGHNIPEGPPPVLRYTRTGADPNLIWRRFNDLELFLPEKKDGRLVISKPLLITERCTGRSGHSGTPSSVVSRGSKVHVIWGEVTDPAEKVAGVPTFVATYDRQTHQLGKPVRIAYGPPANDVHNSPSVTMDSRGHLHALAGTHGRPFPYAHSSEATDAQLGWSEPVLAGANLRQTYIGLVCGPDDTLHLAFRLWRHEEEPFPESHHAVLAYQRKRPGKEWEAPQILVVSPFSEYSVFYHRLTIDRRGRLFLSYDYWSTFWFYRNDHPGRRRALLMSADAGETWKLAQTSDME